ncbi:hypothetical protein H5410_058565 [Solanum commersonii]|uniref:NB-ARC domain-containing protein n=1 Tax=Solanum commersonii TaxID=4109 RepID=A0A9J5WT24_SOLCO|nr:hypothetical protein H5410_058565 [Solanum commersonii]
MIDKVLLLGEKSYSWKRQLKFFFPITVTIENYCCLQITLSIQQISEMEIGLAVGGAFLSSALNVLFDRLAPHDAVDSAENLIEKVNYEALRLKVEGQHQNLAETSDQQVSDLNLCLSDDFFRNIKDKLEETIETLEVLENQIGRLGLKDHFGSTKQETRTPSTSLVDDSDIFGRQNDIEDLIDRLISEDASGKKLTVVPIVGMGGVGKTTLAKAVYNDENVKDHFGLKAWFCVSEAYDAFRITKGLLQEIGSFDLKADDNLNQLQVKLKERLKGKKFLIVLDDVWNDKYNVWDDLRNVFVQGDIGSKIIVTTRKESVSKMMGSGAINVGTMKDPKEHPELEEIGKQIAGKCKGLPLALKALADILRSEIWELPSCSNGILPALMLSYNDLPAHLKQCFAYCAIYPKYYQFRKDQVIHLWIANGLVHQLHSGNQYFLELRSRSLFEMVLESSERDVEKFLMNDLVNDLAQIASSNLCIRLGENKGSHRLEQCRHMSYFIGKDGDFEKLKSLFKSEQLRTLLTINIQHYYYNIKLSKRVLHNILPRLTSLWALSLSGYRIKELPNDLFIKLKLLSFLDFSWIEIKKLPDSVCGLYNLETLLLSSCYYLEELPLQMEKLINLRHLNISNSFRLEMLLHLSKLKSLQVLVGAKFLISGWWMEDLGEAQNLYGSVLVVELQNVVDSRESVKAKMREKNYVDNKHQIHLEVLKLHKCDCIDDISPELLPRARDLRVDDCHNLTSFLIPTATERLSIWNCENVEKLSVACGGTQMTKLSIQGCKKLKWLPERMQELLPSLKKLYLDNCPEIESFPEGGLPFNLQLLKIENCKKLVNGRKEWRLQRLPCLTKLSIYHDGSDEEIAGGGNWELPSSIQTLKVYNLKTLSSQHLKLLNSLQYLDIEQGQFSSFSHLTSLQSLHICNFHNLQSLSESALPSSLSHLEIGKCPNLQSLSESALPSSLSQLIINECSKLQSLPVKGMPSSLSKLSISECPLLTPLLEFDKGKY